MILFLDFDGVLHPASYGDEGPFCRLPLLWQLLRACPTVEVVFSTSWKELHPVDLLVDFTTYGGGEDLAHRFLGTTPSIVREEGASYTGRFHRREAECRLWLVANGQQGRAWLALDDHVLSFSPSCPQLYLVDKSTGLTDADVNKFCEVVNSLEGRGRDPFP